MKKYYPEIIHKTTAIKCVVTTLRKKHRGVWYDWEFAEFYEDEGLQAAIQRLHRNVYLTLLLGKINPKLTIGNSGISVFPKSEIQISEEERLKQQIQ